MLLTQITYLRGCLRSPAWTAAGKEKGKGNETGRTDGREGRRAGGEEKAKQTK